MTDLLFDNQGNLTGIGNSDKEHQRDILINHQGWNKFHPELGVGIRDFVDEEVNAETLKARVVNEFEKDGLFVNTIQLSQDGKLHVDANYQGK